MLNAGDILLIKNATEANAGAYTCTASNHITGERRTSEAATTVVVKEPVEKDKSRMTYRPNEKYQVGTNGAAGLNSIRS